jgi:zinc D-Ala-D-Ala carboxypeptidase
VVTPELQKYYSELGIEKVHLDANRLPFCEQAKLSDLHVVDIDFAGRPFLLHREAVTAWLTLRRLATENGIVLNPASGFRSYLYQKQLIANQLASGRDIRAILTGTAIPGFSEHHTGFAIDICADPAIPEDEFHLTDTYAWMLKSAPSLGFRLSYPKDNPHGIIFEPWHWFFARSGT